MRLEELAGVILSRATNGVEVSAQNVANVTTPGYKSRMSFESALSSTADALHQQSATTIDYSAGDLRSTGNAFDLAISGSGFFAVRNDLGLLYTRNGQFSRTADGRLVTPEGCVLQSTSGDLVIGQGDPKVLADGTVLDGEEPVGRILISDFSDYAALRPSGSGLFSAQEESVANANATIRQGMLESSNVSTAGEMIATMAALRSAQSGQHVMQAYDDLMGRVLTAFGQQ